MRKTIVLLLLNSLLPKALCHEEDDNSCSAIKEDRCTLFLAESTIPNAGWGTFTATSRRIGEHLGAGEVCFPIIESGWHNSWEIASDPFHDYVWLGAPMGMSREETKGRQVSALCPGLGCAVNCHLALINTRRALPEYDPLLVRHEHPAAGSITPYHNATSEALRDIPAGSELFKYYGNTWFTGRTSMIGHVALTYNYEEAESMLKTFHRITSNSSEELRQDLYKLILTLRPLFPKSRTLNGFPDSLDRALLAARESISQAYQADHVRSVEWLQEHGRCQDNIEAGNSTIPGAGRGAFATRKLHKGQIVTASPLHHLPQTLHNFMALYKVSWDEEHQQYIRHLDKIEGYQVAMNYCYGHVESTLLLCPYGAGVSLINHATTTSSSGVKHVANVKLRWAHNFSGHQHALLETITLEELEHNATPLFAFDYVALLDIEKGEELFLDYQKDYEQAFGRHEKEWLQWRGSGTEYVSAVDMNQLVALGQETIRTKQEQTNSPYPNNLEIRCHPHVVLREFIHDNLAWMPDIHGHACRVLDRYLNEDGEWRYTVDVEVWPFHQSPANEKEQQVMRVVRTRVPQTALQFFDKPGTTDLHLPTSFRHWIGIPEEMFPNQWRNRKPSDFR